MARPSIYSYDRTAHGAGSEKDGDRLSGADLRNLESKGYSLQEIVDYAENMKASGATKSGGKADKQLAKFKQRILDEQNRSAPTPAPAPAPAPTPRPQPAPSPSPSPSRGGSADNSTNIYTNITDNSGGSSGGGGSTSRGGGNNTITGNQIGDGAAVVAGDGSSAVGGNNDLSNSRIQTQEKTFNADVDTAGGDFVNTGNFNSDNSFNSYNNSMFNAGGRTSRFDPLASAVENALALQEIGSSGGQIPQGLSATVGDYSGIPKPLNTMKYSNSVVQGNIAEMQSLADVYGNNVMGRRWPVM